MKKILLIIFSILALNFSCEENDNIVEPTSMGKLDYTAYDSTGVIIVEGWLIVNLNDSNAAEGSWILTNLKNRDDIGPQEGEGTLTGSIEGSTITINLNPGNADHNVILNGTLTENGMEGEWVWVSFIGPTNWGTFKAVKN
jgi:hypothetical protein